MAITPYSGVVPNRLSAGDNEVYATQVYNWFIYLDGTWVSTVNSTEANINAKETTATAAAGTATTAASTATTKATLAADYAEKMALEVETGTYSSKEHAIGDLTTTGGSAKAWAIDDSSPDGTTTKSAKTHSEDAAVSAAAALISENAAAALLDSFDDRYLGAKTADPTLDNDGNPLTSGALYYNTTSDTMFVYDLELATWISLTFTPTDHGSLSGLADDDHAQYHNDARGDARYYTKTLLDAGQLDNRYYTETEVNSLLSAKQATLVSGTNIKTVGGVSIMGSGDISVGSTANYQEFTASGTWTKPSGVNYVYVECLAGGGGGGSQTSTNLVSGGGGGEYINKVLLASTVGVTETITIAAGGAGGAAGSANNGVDGGNSSFGAHVTSFGGKKGLSVGYVTSMPRATSVSTNLDVEQIVFPHASCGGSSNRKGQSCVYGGGGGGGAGTSTSTIGGTSGYAGGGGEGSYTSSGQNGTYPSGGGGGANGGFAGGTGAAGRVRIWAW